mgnify:CR=1 FL=1
MLFRSVIPPRLLLAGVVASIVPDADVAGMRLGIHHDHDFGHRGSTHSLFFAACLGGLAAFASNWLRASALMAFAFVAVATASHGLLDMCTNGGSGIALFWPLSAERYFFPWQVIEVSPLGIKRFFSERGWVVLASELLWVWLPLMATACGWRWMQAPRK